MIPPNPNRPAGWFPQLWFSQWRQLVVVFVVIVGLTLPAMAFGQSKRKRRRGKSTTKIKVIKKPSKRKVFDFTGLDLAGRLRTPQLLYFLDRASEELQRASLERRSFIPEMVRTLDEEAL